MLYSVSMERPIVQCLDSNNEIVNITTAIFYPFPVLAQILFFVKHSISCKLLFLQYLSVSTFLFVCQFELTWNYLNCNYLACLYQHIFPKHTYIPTYKDNQWHNQIQVSCSILEIGYMQMMICHLFNISVFISVEGPFSLAKQLIILLCTL